MNLKALLTGTILATATLAAAAAVRPHSKTIVVESPETLPLLSQNDAVAMYLYDAHDGSTLLYVETDHGHMLTALDVTDPADIRRVAQVTLSATTAFDFADLPGQQAVLIRYRDGSGVALLNLRHYKHPTLVTSPALLNAVVSEPLGETGTLVTTSPAPQWAAGPQLRSFRSYKVMDTANPVQPALLATTSDVKQRLAKDDTGTLFLLNRDGITVVRRLLVEAAHQLELDSQRGN
jgi:hypothetical protein